MLGGWVIVYVPGGNIYQMLDNNQPKKTTLAKKIAKHSLKTILAAAQVYWWIKT